jgi:hypothetical protein
VTVLPFPSIITASLSISARWALADDGRPHAVAAATVGSTKSTLDELVATGHRCCPPP